MRAAAMVHSRSSRAWLRAASVPGWRASDDDFLQMAVLPVQVAQ
jgi:hypothetical protein